MSIKERLINYLKPNKKSLILAFVFAFFYVASQISQPFLLGRALDASKVGDRTSFLVYVFVAFGLVIVGAVFAYFFEVLITDVSQKIIKKARDEVFRKINAISVKDFDQKRQGDIVQLEIRDMENFASGLFAVFKTLIQGIFTIIITILMMVLVNWVLALVVIFLTPLSVLMSSIVSLFSHKHYKKQSELQANVSSISLEALNNIDIVQSLNYEETSASIFDDKNEKLKKVGKIAQFSASWVNPSTRLVNNIIYVIVGVLGVIMLSYNTDLALVFAVMSIGRLSSFLSYTNQYSKPFNEISNVAGEYENAKASLKRINDFLNLEEDINEGTININDIETIEFKDTTFAYTPEQNLFKNFNLVINKGQKVAIVGPTGAGKTTLINLIMRFYDPVSGDIHVNDQSYLDISKESLRKNFGMVLQDTWIFSGTIADNIRYLKPDATREEVERAATRAHADIFINTLPEGYETVVSNKQGLSEGQRQMIAIARVMLARPKIIILDEATSNIDTRSEKLITKAFDQMMRNRTSIVIAHRLSTVETADIIIVMDEGKIVETGNHEELMDKRGFYYSLYSSQYR
ncbi:MAG TPA: ABC transporter ATP-binding protein [Erysipelotrichaceae bacterium]|nr:ABC transporter ATP-binding protein [Erysipelotrichaceae bacterium]